MSEEFGRKLRIFRNNTRDPQKEGNSRLTQARFAELISLKSGQTIPSEYISRWERNERPFPLDTRELLLAVIHVLYEHGGITSLAEADDLPYLLNARALDKSEKIQINPNWLTIAATEEASPLQPSAQLGKTVDPLSTAPPQFQDSKASAIVWRFIQWLEKWTFWHGLGLCLLVLLFLLEHWLLTPILEWPLISKQSERQAACIRLVIAAFVLPLPASLLPYHTNSAKEDGTVIARFVSQYGGACLGINSLLLVLVSIVLPILSVVRLLPLPSFAIWVIYFGLGASSFLLAQHFAHLQVTTENKLSEYHDSVLWLFAVAVALYAGVIYFGYADYIRPNIVLCLLISCIAFFVWHMWKNHSLTLNHYQAILVIAALAAIALTIGIGFDPTLKTRSLSLSVETAFLLHLTLLTVFIAPICITLVLFPKVLEQIGPKVLIGVTISTFFVVCSMLLMPSVWAWALPFGIWALWTIFGRKNWKHTLWFNSSYIAVNLLTAMALNLLLRQQIAPLLIYLCYLIFAGLIGWQAIQAEYIRSYGTINLIKNDSPKLKEVVAPTILLAVVLVTLSVAWSVWSQSTTAWPVATLRHHTDSVQQLAWHSETNELLSSSADTSIVGWNMETYEPIQRLKRHSKAIRALDWCSMDANLVASGDNGGIGLLWQLQAQESFQHLRGHDADIRSISWSPDCSKVVTSAEDNSLIVWQPETGEILFNVTDTHTDWVRDVDWNPNSEYFASTGRDNLLVIWQADTGTPIAEKYGVANTQVQWSPNGLRLAAANTNGQIFVWDGLDLGKPVLEIDAHNQTIYDIDWHPSGEYLATTSKDGMILVWHTDSGDRIMSYNSHDNIANAIAWSPDGSLLASGGWGRQIFLWEFNR